MPLGAGALATTPDGAPGYAVQVSRETALLIRAATEYPGQTEVVDLTSFVVDTSRHNDKRPATLRVICPDEIVKSLTGEKERRGRLLALWVPREVLDDLRRVESGIATPAEAAAGGGPLIVTP